MKKIRKNILAIAVCCSLGMTSCDKILDIEQVSEITSASMWKSDGDFTSAVNGMYVQFREAYATNLLLWGDLRSGLYGQGKIVDVGHANIMANTIYRDNEGTDWSGLYKTINTANLLLKYGATNLSDGVIKNEVLANAYFIRAFNYFWIARIWGDAPLLTTGFESDSQSDLYPERSPKAELFNLVEQDILQAEQLMGTLVGKQTKVSPTAIQMLKADYFLWKAKQMGGGNEALSTADKSLDAVISTKTGLLADFSQVFNINNEKNTEIICTMDLQRDQFVGGYPLLFLIPNQYVVDKSLIENPVKIGSAQQYISLTDAFNTFVNAQADDSRKAISVMNVTENGVLHRWINKFPGEWINATRFFSSNIPLYRTAEAYLMKAEIQLALQNPAEAVKQLNVVAKRAYKRDNVYTTGLGDVAITSAILDEYTKEFVAEGKSWFVLVRNNAAFSRIPSLHGKENQKNILLWPITSAAINTNPNIKQTEGYN